MSRLRTRFETQLKQKLQQKCPSKLSEESFLYKAFRFIDLDNSNTVSRDEWIRAIEKIGIVVEDPKELELLFEEYDSDGSGEIDYREFVAALFGANSAVAKRLTPQKSMPPSEEQRAEDLLEAIKERLLARGARGLIGLSRQFKIMDDDSSGKLEFQEFLKALHDYRVPIPEEEAELIFDYIDRDRSGSIDYDEFVRAVRGPMNAFRKELVAEAFHRLDLDNSGVIDLSDIKQVYDPSSHPEVLQGVKSEEDVLNEFLETFELHHSLNGRRDRRVTFEEFEEYYNNISASIDNDKYFEVMIVKAWGLDKQPPQPQKSPSKQPNQVEIRNPRSVQEILEKFREKLAARGVRGILGLARQFKIMDDDNSKFINYNEFRKACRDYRITVDDKEIQLLYEAIDVDDSGEINYDELLRAIRGPLNSFRKGLVDQAWNKLDKDRNGVLDIDDIRDVYSAKQHPDVRAGKRTEDDVLGEFLETFEMHHNLKTPSARDRRVTYEEFLEYYNNVSASIDDDRYFELMMTNAWKLRGEPPARESWAGAYTVSHKTSWLADHHRSQLGGTVNSSAPFGTSDEPVDYATSMRPRRGNLDLLELSSSIPAAGRSVWSKPAAQQSHSSFQQAEGLLERLRNKLAARGAKGFIGLKRQFKIMDDNGNNKLDIGEFIKGMRDFRVEISEDEAGLLFRYLDADRSGSIDYEEFLHRLQGPMNPRRKQVVEKVFQKLDKTGDGYIMVDDLRGVYNVSLHPDVRMGKKSEDEVLCDFLDTFEVHHAMFKGGRRDAKVTLEEFMEYYQHVSASITDDRYFDLMMKNAWNLDNVSYGKGWRGEC